MIELNSNISVTELYPNFAVMLRRHAATFGAKTVFQYRQTHSGKFISISWAQLYNDIKRIAFNLSRHGFQKGDKLLLYSRNRLEMLETELAVMASGGVAVPIFAHFKKETSSLLIRHSDARWIAAAGKYQLDNLNPELPINKIWVFDDVKDMRFPTLSHFSDLLEPADTDILNYELQKEQICLNMYTSGTMGIPKCVQLSCGNILSQQEALNALEWWNIDENDRFLSYLPWHHSFGGIFELFNALYRGATISLESSYGKNPEEIFNNWDVVRPTVFFSVPKVYQALFDLTRKSREAENMFFNSGLKFIFTAAAPLPAKLSDEFEKRGIPVIEGWGLTETSPCCTLTDPAVKRETGVVGKPIPGVSVRIAKDEEIQVKGPNVMRGYYKNDEANKHIFTEDGWYRTGDVGTITESGLKLISRKDRIFKLSNGEKVVPTDLEKIIETKCHYISFAIVTGGGREYPVALLFPNKKLLDNKNKLSTQDKACSSPSSLYELSQCLCQCLHEANCGIGQKFSKIQAAALIDEELSVDDGTLTPSMKVAPKKVVEIHKDKLSALYEGIDAYGEDVFVIRLDKSTQLSNTILQHKKRM